MIYLYIVICFIVYLVCDNDTLVSMGVYNGHEFGAFTYMLSHASLLHLLMNTFCMTLMYKPIFNLFSKRFETVSNLKFFGIVYFCSVLAAFLTAQNTPTIGMSGMVFTLLGMLLALNPTLQQLKSFIYVALAILIQLYFGKSNVALHVCAFAVGALTIIIKIAYDNIRIHSGE